MVVPVKIAANGRVCIPADVRARLGLKDGDTLLLDETDDGLVFRTLSQAVREAQAWSRQILGDQPNATVDDFIAEKRQEVKRLEERDAERYG